MVVLFNLRQTLMMAEPQSSNRFDIWMALSSILQFSIYNLLPESFRGWIPKFTIRHPDLSRCRL